MERKTSTEQDHNTQLADDYDDIYISDDDDFEEQIICQNSSDEEDQGENKDAENLQNLYQSILLFITEYVGDDAYKEFTTGRKISSENPFVFEVFQNQTTMKLNKKKCSKKQNKKNKKQKQKLSDAQEAVVSKEKTILEIQEDDKALMLKKKEMKAKIKELLPKDPPKPLFLIDDEPEYHIIEVNGEYRKVSLEMEKKREARNKIRKFDKSTEVKINLQDIIQKQKQEEEEAKQKEKDEKQKENEEKQRIVDEEMIRLAIEMSMKDFEDEEIKREEVKKQEKLDKNPLAKSLASDGAKLKYSKEGFVPKALRKEEPKLQENISENEYYDYGHEYYNPRSRGRARRGGYSHPRGNYQGNRGYSRVYY